MIRRKLSIHWLLVLFLLIAQANVFVCAQNGKVKLGEIFTLQSGESAEIEEAKLKIRLSSVGRTIAESGEVEYVELQVHFNKTISKSLRPTTAAWKMAVFLTSGATRIIVSKIRKSAAIKSGNLRGK